MQTIIVTVNQQGEKTALQIETYCHITKHRCTLRFDQRNHVMIPRQQYGWRDCGKRILKTNN